MLKEEAGALSLRSGDLKVITYKEKIYYTPPRSGSEAILLAEDDALRNLTEILPRELGYHVVEAKDGKEE